MLIPKVEAKEFEKFGFKKCKGEYGKNGCYYLCVANLTQAEADLIDSVVSDASTPFTTVSYVDVNGKDKTIEAYFGDPTYSIRNYDVNKKQQTYDSVSVSTIQQ